MTPAVAGVDGARGAWLVALLHGGRVELSRHPEFASVVELADERSLAVVAVDMPIGLPASAPRAADRQARAMLGPRRSTLFPTPVLAVLDASGYTDACRRSELACGRRISIQAYNLVPMVRQLRQAVPLGAANRFVEVHPETSFVALAGRPLAPKRSSRGVAERVAALGPALDLDPGVDLADLVASRPRGVAPDDALDALAAAWSARRFATGVARVLGADDGCDPTGYPLRIVV